MKDNKIMDDLNYAINTENTSARIAIIIPCLNEEKTISKVINDFKKELPEAKIIVADNNSIDKSREIAMTCGATVITEKRRGKGIVLQTAFNEIDSDIYIMVDADDTYPSEEIKKLIEPILNDEADMVVGSRLEYATNRSLKLINRIGNILILNILNLCFSSNLKDVLSGYRVMKKDFVKNVPVLSTGFEIETELTLQALVRHFRILEIPVIYRERTIGSSSKIKVFKDGLRILITIITLMRDYKPFVFFSSITIFFVVLGLIAGSNVVYEYLQTGLVTRLPLAVLSITFIIIGVIFFVTGFIISTLNRRFREIDVFIRGKK